MLGASFKLSLLVAVAVLPVCAEVNQSWQALVETLKPDRKVVVVQHSRKQAEGKLLSLTGESITVRVSGQPLTIQRDDVFRVRIANIRRRNTLLGMAIATGVGALVGYKNGGVAFAGAIMSVGPGAAVGGALPIGKPLYEAPGGLKKAGQRQAGSRQEAGR